MARAILRPGSVEVWPGVSELTNSGYTFSRLVWLFSHDGVLRLFVVPEVLRERNMPGTASVACRLHSVLCQRLARSRRPCLLVAARQDVAEPLVWARVSLSQLAHPLVQLGWAMLSDEGVTEDFLHLLLIVEVILHPHVDWSIALCLVLVDRSIPRVSELLRLAQLGSPDGGVRLISI